MAATAWLAGTAPPALAGVALRDAPLFDGMGRHRASDASSSALARRYVAQGMVLAWGFNPQEAARSFAGALQADPACAAAAWGVAWALGPTINADLAPSDAPRVAAALRQAHALQHRAAPRWRGLIAALGRRHPHADVTAVDEEAYEGAMARLQRSLPGDADIAVLAAEALMNLHPYDWWRPGGGAQPWTGAIEDRLQRALALAPDHPGAHHAWVHLQERSPAPQRAAASAAALQTLVPGSAHLLHMPAHIHMRLGRYAQASAAGEAAAEADRRYLAQVDAQGAYRVGYVAHNHHFLWASAAMEGRGERALAAAEGSYTAACGSRGPDLGNGTVQHFQALPALTRVRFGHWRTLATATPPPDGDAPYALALWHYARGTAWLRLGQPDDARQQLQRLQWLQGTTALRGLRVKSVHPASQLLAIAEHTLRADLALHDRDGPEALALLRQAVAIEDALPADEPHLWLAPTRHALGAACLQLGQWQEALATFSVDLQHYPDNGWSLAGVVMAERQLGRAERARRAEERLRRAWRAADAAPSPRL